MKLLKKIRRIANSQKSSHSSVKNLPPISFHPIHGENIHLSSNGMVATRVGSFCKGICFSSRPIKVNERVTIRFLEMSSLWSGLLRFGFTTKDPATFSSLLPKYACPDLTNGGHTHAKALPEVFAQKRTTLFFYVTLAGNVHYGVNGEEKGVILTNVKVNSPIWAVIDVYGNTTKIESIDCRQQLNNKHPNNPNENDRLHSSRSMIDLSEELMREPSPQIYSNKSLNQVRFHRFRGRNIRLSADKTIAERDSNNYTNGYVFTQKSLAVGEKLVIQVLKTTNIFTGSLAFGLTSCDPAYLDIYDLPENSHNLLDRPEYWVVIKDVANRPAAGDEISFCVTPRGEVQMTKNRQSPITLMHVDISQRLWGFFDIYGSTVKVRMLGSQPQSINAHLNRVPNRRIKNNLSISMYDVHNLSGCDSNKSSKFMKQSYQKKETENNYCAQSSYYPQNEAKNNIPSGNTPSPIGGDCIICYERPINSVLYSCGHMFMCYSCSVKQLQTSGICPMCRAPIRDVIRTYWS